MEHKYEVVYLHAAKRWINAGGAISDSCDIFPPKYFIEWGEEMVNLLIAMRDCQRGMWIPNQLRINTVRN